MHVFILFETNFNDISFFRNVIHLAVTAVRRHLQHLVAAAAITHLWMIIEIRDRQDTVAGRQSKNVTGT
jgi:hypothetical protein